MCQARCPGRPNKSRLAPPSQSSPLGGLTFGLAGPVSQESELRPERRERDPVDFSHPWISAQRMRQRG